MRKIIRVRLDLSIPPRTLILSLAALLLFTVSSELASENVTLTTYYPAPSGVYARMITTSDTILARDTGNVGIRLGGAVPGSQLSIGGTAAIGAGYATQAAPANGMIVQGRVGIGTNIPNAAYALDINGATNVAGNLDVGGRINVGCYWKFFGNTLAVAETCNSVATERVVAVDYGGNPGGPFANDPFIVISAIGGTALAYRTTGRMMCCRISE